MTRSTTKAIARLAKNPKAVQQLVVPPRRQRARTPQREDGRATHQKIVEAAVAVLAEQGWRAASVGEVAKRAKVTRGAIQHHFKDRDGLFAASVQHILELRLAAFEAMQTEDYSEGADRTRSIVQTIVDMHQDEIFAATLQMCVAASTDTSMTPRMAAAELEMGARAFWLFVDLLKLDGSSHKVRTTLMAFLDSARGLGLAGLLNDDARRRAAVTERWVELIEDVRLHP